MKAQIVGWTTSAITAGTTMYEPFVTQQASNSWNTALTAAQQIPLPHATTIDRLMVMVKTAPGTGKNFVFTVLKNGVATALTATISGTNTTASDTTHSVSFAPGDLITMQGALDTGGTVPAGVYWNVRQDAAGMFAMLGDITSASTGYLPVMGSGTPLAVGDAGVIVPMAGTVTNLFINAAASGGIWQIYQNGNAGPILITSMGGLTANDTGHSFTVAAGDRIAIRNTGTGVVASWGISFAPSVDGQSFVSGVTNGNVSTTATTYIPATQVSGSPSTTESSAMLQAATLVAIYGQMATSPGVSPKAYTFQGRKNVANISGGSFSILDANAAPPDGSSGRIGNVTPNAVISDYDLLDTAITPVSTPIGSHAYASMLISMTAPVNAAIAQVGAAVTAGGGTQALTGGGGTPSIALLQTKSGNGGNYTNSYSFTFTSNVTAGSALILTITAGSADSIASLTDNHGNTWVSGGSSTNTSAGRQTFLYAAYNAAAGATTVTITFEAGANPDSAFIAREYSGIATSAALDKTSANNDGGNYIQTHDAGATSATAQAGELIILAGGIAASSEPTLAAGTGYANGLEQKGFDVYTYAFMADKIVSATGVQSGNFTSAGYVSGQALIATFKAAGGSSGPVNASITHVAAHITAAGGTQSALPSPPGAINTPNWYKYGQLPNKTVTSLVSATTSFWTSQLKRYIVQTGMPAGMPGTAYRVQRPENANDTVSEGMGYAMVLAAYLGNPAVSGYDTGAHAIFDGLWQYVSHYLDSNGLMNWHIDSSGNIMTGGTGSATDGDYDIAWGLHIASQVWGNAGTYNYAALRDAYLANILAYDIYSATNSNTAIRNVQINGDSWDASQSGSPDWFDADYFAPAYFGAWSSLNSRWSTIKSANYPIYNVTDTFSTGLVPDQQTRAGAAVSGQSYENGYNAIRRFRQVLDYLWYGSTQPGFIDYYQHKHTADFIATASGGVVANQYAEYAIDGSTHAAYTNAAFKASYMVTMLINGDHSTLAGATIDSIVATPDGSYFGDFLAGMALLTASGLFVATPAGSATITQVAATVTANGGTQAIARSQNVSIAQVAAAVTANGGTQSLGSSITASIIQAAASITATGGTQTISIGITITQSAANVAVNGGTQVVTPVRIASLSQLAANITAGTGTQLVNGARIAAITQAAASILAAGGTQSAAGVITGTVNISQVAAVATATGGTMVITAQKVVVLVQAAATITAAPGTHSIATVNNANVSHVSGPITATGGVQAIVTVGDVDISQVAANVTAAQGANALLAVQLAAITQQAANIIAAGGQNAVVGAVKTAITQTGASVTAYGGTSSVNASRKISITQITASVAITAGSQAVASVQDVAIAQSAGLITATGGATSTQEVNNAMVMAPSGVVIADGGTHAVASVEIVSIEQLTSSIMAHGGLETIATQNYVRVTQVSASIRVGFGTQDVDGQIATSVLQQAAEIIATGGIQMATGGNTVDIWDGTEYVAKPIKAWDGTTWHPRPIKRYSAAGAWDVV